MDVLVNFRMATFVRQVFALQSNSVDNIWPCHFGGNKNTIFLERVMKVCKSTLSSFDNIRQWKRSMSCWLRRNADFLRTKTLDINTTIKVFAAIEKKSTFGIITKSFIIEFHCLFNDSVYFINLNVSSVSIKQVWLSLNSSWISGKNLYSCKVSAKILYNISSSAAVYQHKSKDA